MQQDDGPTGAAMSSVATSPEGGHLATTLTEAFASMHLAVSRLQPGPLALSCSSTIMMYWLIPRLERFKQANPTVELRLNVSYGEVDFIRDEISVAIRTSMYKPPPTAVIRQLIDEEIGPICHPDYAAQRSLVKPEDIERARILVAATRPSAWKEWAEAIGRPGLALEPHESYEHFYLAIQAAACGLGVALAPRILVEGYIRTGHLMAPFGFSPGPHKLELWIAPHLRSRTDVRRLTSWLSEEMRGSTGPQHAEADACRGRGASGSGGDV